MSISDARNAFFDARTALRRNSGDQDDWQLLLAAVNKAQDAYEREAAKLTGGKLVRIGDEQRGHAANGHTLIYEVVGFENDGYPKLQQYNAYCADDCAACTEGYPLEDW